MNKSITLTVSLLCSLGVSAWAADFSDPTWPCIQRKVERLSAGVMWPQALPEDVSGLSAEASELAETLALRRVSLEESEQLIAAFAERNPEAGADIWGGIFQLAFTQLDRSRTQLIRGIERYSTKQIDLSEAIDQLRLDMDAALAAAEPDYDKIDAMEVDLDWKTRIFDDRARSLLYVCESPVLMEKRIFALARMLLARLPG